MKWKGISQGEGDSQACSQLNPDRDELFKVQVSWTTTPGFEFPPQIILSNLRFWNFVYNFSSKLCWQNLYYKSMVE